MGEAVVRAEGLRKVFEPFPWWLRTMVRTAIREPVVALDGVDLELEAGAVCAVIGPNGAGKSTFFRIVTGLTVPTEGRATVLGMDSSTHSAELRRHIGFMAADDRSLFLQHSCRENLRFHGRMHGFRGPALRAAVDDALTRVGLASVASRSGFALSAGMRARLQLARSILHRPRVLVLDEPTSSVDPVAAAELLDLITRLADEDRVAVLLSSHRLEDIETLRDHVMLLDRGRVLHSGPLEVLRANWRTPRLRLRFSEAEAARRARGILAARKGIDAEPIGDLTLDVPVTGAPGAVLEALDGSLGHLESVSEHRVSLREVLSAITRGTARSIEDRHAVT